MQTEQAGRCARRTLLSELRPCASNRLRIGFIAVGNRRSGDYAGCGAPRADPTGRPRRFAVFGPSTHPLTCGTLVSPTFMAPHAGHGPTFFFMIIVLSAPKREALTGLERGRRQRVPLRFPYSRILSGRRLHDAQMLVARS